MIPHLQPEPDHPSAAAQTSSAELAARLHSLLGDGPRRTLACAESCTGGLIAARITANAGSSDYFQGSAVTYSNAAKRALLGVPQAVLDRVGAVSAACAVAMADGARATFAADFAVSTTGIAGPGGATGRKPVGLVYIALATAEGTSVAEHHFAGDRASVVEQATAAALARLIAHLDTPTTVSSSAAPTAAVPITATT